jgi:hypothetical protein
MYMCLKIIKIATSNHNIKIYYWDSNKNLIYT